MTVSENRIEKSVGKHRLYIFSVTFLAALVICVLCWPTQRPSYRSLAIIGVDQQAEHSASQEAFAARLKEASKDVLTAENLQRILDSVKEMTNAHKQSNLLAGHDLNELRSHLEIGVGKGKKESQYLASVALSGSGTRDELEFVNCVAGQLIESMKTGEPIENQLVIGEIQRQFEVSQARERGLRNVANLIADQNLKKLNVYRSLELQIDQQVHQVPNPAWRAYRDRLQNLLNEQTALKSEQKGEADLVARANLIQVQEEIRFLQSQLTMEPELLTFDVEKESEIIARQKTEPMPESLPAVTEEDYTSTAPDGPTVQKNQFYTQVSEKKKETVPAPAPQPPINSIKRVRLVDHQKMTESQDTIDEINAQIRTLENEQSRLQAALADQKSISQPKSTEVMRLLQPALNAKPLSSGVTRNQFMMILMLSIGFATVITLKAGSIVPGSAFHSAEEVARKLRIAVIGTVPVGSTAAAQSRQSQMIWLKRIVFGCEFTLIGFSIIMLTITIINSDISIAIRENPFVGFMEAVRMIKPW